MFQISCKDKTSDEQTEKLIGYVNPLRIFLLIFLTGTRVVP